MSCDNCTCTDCRMGRARERRRKAHNASLYGTKCRVALRGGAVCGGTIGPDIFDEPMCYSCGPAGHLPPEEMEKLSLLQLARRRDTTMWWRP